MRLVSKQQFNSARSRDLIDLRCDFCDRIFWLPKHEAMRRAKRGTGKTYCSPLCSNDSQRRNKPKPCKQCGKDCRKIFCSHRCSALFNNPLKANKKKKCLECGVKHSNKKFCSHGCNQKNKEKAVLVEWRSGARSGLTKNGFLCETVRRYLLGKYDNKCSRCGWCEVNHKSGKVPVQIEHIDGDFRNCSESNLIVLCPNCHSLTPTYMSLNRGNGRDVNGMRRKKDAGIAQQEEHIIGNDTTGVRGPISAPRFLM